MRYLIIILIAFFVLSAFFGNLNLAIDNSFIGYIFYLLNIFVKFFPIFLILISVVFIFLIWRHYSKRHSTKKGINTFLQAIEVLIISIFFAFIILILIAFIQLNSFSILLNKNPSLLGVKTNINEIYSAIEKNARPPEIISSDKNSQNQVLAISKAASGTNNFYGKYILNSIPRIFILPVKNSNSNLLFLDNTLVVVKVDVEDMQKISPLIGYLLVKNYFPERDIKSYPKVSVMDEEEYMDFRNKDIKEKITKINSESLRMESAISSLSASIETDTEEIAKNKLDQEKVLEDRDKEYNACLSEGTYKNNVFTPKNPKEECKKINEEWEVIFIETENKGKALTKKLESDKTKLKTYEYYDSFFKAQKKLTDISTDNVPSELGVFIPPDSLKVVVLSSSSNSIADYFVTLSHEYLHYASFVPGKRLDSSFFEEGLTEYFARQAIKSSMQVNTNIGYPITSRVIEEIINSIPESDLAEVYFTKDQLGLEKILNLVYGDNFYSDNIVLLETLQYTSDPDQAINLANTILSKVNGNPLSKDDIFSTDSGK